MEVKGTAIKTTRDFVKTKFENRFNEWLNNLSPQSKEIYSGVINIGGWFPVETAYYQPIDTIVKMFYDGNSKLAGDDLGRYSAEVALKGVYKVFLLVATPQYLMKRAAMMMEAFYNPCTIQIADATANQLTFKIIAFDQINQATEYRIAAWCLRALELCNCQNVNYKFFNQLSAGQNETIIKLSWE